LWEQTLQRRLGYAIDELYYGTPGFLEGYRQAMVKMTPATLHAAIKRHLKPDQMSFVFVTQNAQELAQMLHHQKPSPIKYPTPKHPSVLEIDKQIIEFPVPVDPTQIKIQDAQTFMEE
jgi:zinc protease